MSANDRTGVGAGSAEWRTPPEIFARLQRRFDFGYDAFASADNALALLYSTPAGTFQAATVPHDCAHEPVCEETWPPERVSECDGLTYPWRNRRVYLNPPYSRGFVERACAKAAAERDEAEIIVGLLPANTDTGWFHEHIVGKATVHFLRKRVRFLRPDGTPGDSPPGGSMVVVWLPDWLP